jgi:hypothetical protein
VTHADVLPLITTDEPVLATELSISHIATSGDGWLVVHRDGSLRLGARVLAKDGTPSGPGFDVTTEGEATAAGVAFDGEAYVVVWIEERPIARILKYRRVGTDGQLLGPAVELRSGGTGVISQVAVASGDEGTLVINCGVGEAAGCEPFLIDGTTTSGGFVSLAEGPANVSLAYSDGAWLLALGSYDAPKTSLWRVGANGSFTEAAPLALATGGQEAFPTVAPYEEGFLVAWNAGKEVLGANVASTGSVTALSKPIATWLTKIDTAFELMSSAGGLALFSPGSGVHWLKADLTVDENFVGVAGTAAAMDATSLISAAGPRVNRVGIGTSNVTFDIPIVMRQPNQILQGVAAGPHGYLVAYFSEGRLFVSRRAGDGSPSAPPILISNYDDVPIQDMVGTDDGWLLSYRYNDKQAIQRVAADGSLQPFVAASAGLSFHGALAKRPGGALLVYEQADGANLVIRAAPIAASGMVGPSELVASVPQSPSSFRLTAFRTPNGHEVVWSTREQGLWSARLNADGVMEGSPAQLSEAGSSARTVSGVTARNGRWLAWADSSGDYVRPPAGQTHELSGSASLQVLDGTAIVAWASPPQVHVALGAPNGELAEVEAIDGASFNSGSAYPRPFLSEPRGRQFLCAFTQIQREYGNVSRRAVLSVLEAN